MFYFDSIFLMIFYFDQIYCLTIQMYFEITEILNYFDSLNSFSNFEISK